MVDKNNHQMICLACGYSEEPKAHEKDENGCCALCSEVRVTLNGKTTYLSSLADALKPEYDGAVLTLIRNINVDSEITLSDGSFTLDLNGHTVNFYGDNARLHLEDSAKLTIRDGKGTGGFKNSDPYDPSIYLTIISDNLDNRPVLTLEGGSFNNISPAVGTLIVDNENVNIGRLDADGFNIINGGSDIRLSAGTYGEINIQYYGVDGIGLGSLLLNYGEEADKHYAFYNSEGEPISAAADSSSMEIRAKNVTVKECTHANSNLMEYNFLNEQQHEVTDLSSLYMKAKYPLMAQRSLRLRTHPII